MNDFKKIGKIGENIATSYLKNNSFVIKARNWHSRYGEIDIIAQKNGSWHFIEVKTRSNLNFGWPEEAIDNRKLKKIWQTIHLYRQKNGLWSENIQLDVISITLNLKTRRARLEYIKNFG